MKLKNKLFYWKERIVLGPVTKGAKTFTTAWIQHGWEYPPNMHREISYKIDRPDSECFPHYEWRTSGYYLDAGDLTDKQNDLLDKFNVKLKTQLKPGKRFSFIELDDRLAVINIGGPDYKDLRWDLVESTCREIGLPLIKVEVGENTPEYFKENLLKFSSDAMLFVRSTVPNNYNCTYEIWSVSTAKMMATYVLNNDSESDQIAAWRKSQLSCSV